MVAQANWLLLVAFLLLLLVEGAHWLSRVGEDLDWSIVDFGNCLQLDIVAPNSESLFPSTVLLNGDVFLCNERLEIIFGRQNIVHTLLPYQFMDFLVSIKLECNCSE